MERQRRKDVNDNVARGARMLDYLGYCFTPGNVRMRKSIKQNFARKAKRIKNKKRRREVLASYWGWCKWADCRHLWNVITDNDMSFADKGITGRNITKDGKEFYDIMQVKADNIINIPIKVLSFIPGINTKHGPNRYAVKISINGEERKWITGSVTIKSMLDQAQNKDAFPIDTVLRKRDLGGGMKDYIFD